MKAEDDDETTPVRPGKVLAWLIDAALLIVNSSIVFGTFHRLWKDTDFLMHDAVLVLLIAGLVSINVFAFRAGRAMQFPYGEMQPNAENFPHRTVFALLMLGILMLISIQLNGSGPIATLRGR